MTQRTHFSCLLPSALLALLCAWPLFGCNSAEDTTRTGSESHFVRCDDDQPCAVGTCKAGYCELNGRRLTQETARETPAESDPSPQEPDGGAPATGPSGLNGSPEGGSGGADSPSTPSGSGGAPAGQAGTGAAGQAGTGGASSSTELPRAFRIVNETSAVVYVDGTQPVRCGALASEASCWYTTADLCMVDCSATAVGSQCALNCEQPTAFALRLQPGQEQLVPWDGSFVARNANHCSDGDCIDVSPIADGSHVAWVRAYAAVACQFEPCVPVADGITEGYQTAGSYRHVQVGFAIPSTEEEIAIVVREDSLSCPSAPEPCCGDGLVTGGETCDDGNRADGDACDATCGQGGAGAGGSSGTGGAGTGGAGTGGAGTGGASSTIVTCGDATCAAGEYCRAACSGDGGGDPEGPPQCAPLPAGCEEDPSCDCVCGGFTLFCTPGAEAIQCGCA